MPSRVLLVALLAAPCGAAPALDIISSWPIAANASSPPNATAAPSLRGAAQDWWPGFYYRWAPQVALMELRVRMGVFLPASDPLWEQARSLIRTVAYATAPGKKFMDLCSAGRLEEYSREACAPNTFGNINVGGIPADAFFCGSTRSGIDWARPWWGSTVPPVKRICEAEPGTAYNATGFCGRWTTRELVLSFFFTTPVWGADPVTMNIPGMHCLFGLGNCDIHYCQHCPRRCGP